LKTKGKAYVVDEQTDSEGDISIDSALEEYAAVTQDTASKISLDEWIPDTAASSNMTNNLKNFHGPLKPIPRRVIKVGGGRLFSRYIGVAEIRLKDGRSMRLKDCLYVPCLGANLLSARRICTTSKLRGAFDATKMYIHKNNKVLLLASFRDGVYIVDHIATDDHERAYGAQEVPQEAMEIDLTGDPAAAVSLHQASLMDEVAEPRKTLDSDSDNGEPVYSKAERITRKRLERYKLFHRRFGHVGPNALRILHTGTNLTRSIKVPTDLEICDVCAVTKMKRRNSKVLAKHKDCRLALLSVDIAGLFPISMRGYRWFAEIIDNWSRKVWILLLKNKDDIIPTLNNLAVVLERQSREKILASRSDNAGEIQKVLGEWKTKDRVIPQSTALYSSYQNGLAERGIQSSEHDI
jgi:hypothetical protein